jgi:hypothetical protein
MPIRLSLRYFPRKACPHEAWLTVVAVGGRDVRRVWKQWHIGDARRLRLGLRTIVGL